jgi:hypothetical protein
LKASVEVSWMNRRFADFFYFTHIFVTIFCGFMWIGPYEWMWWGVFILYGLTEILWFFRDSYCILTDIERYFRKVPRPDDASQQNFIRRLVKSFFGFDINPKNAQVFTRFWGRFGWAIASIRLFII